MEREEYLKNEFIKGVTYLIDTNEVKIESPSTIFIHVVLPDKLGMIQVENLFQKLKRMAREKRVKLKGIRKAKKRAEECHGGYREICEEMRKLFVDLVKLCTEIEKDGIHYVYSEDEKLNKAIEIANEIRMERFNSYKYNTFMITILRVNEAICDIESLKEGELLYVNI